MVAGGRFFLKLFVLAAICLTGGSVFSFYSLLYEQNDVGESAVVLVEKGDSVTKIANRLKRDGFLNSVAVFKVAARLSGRSTSLKAGEYRLPAHASAKEILDILESGQTVVRRVTVPEGKTSRQIFDILMQTAGLAGELPPPPPNGLLLPETYVFSYGSPRSVIYDRMRSGMQKTLDDLWDSRDPDLPYTTREEALVMASIVEKETAIPAERPRIAGVFVNRLRKGMRLQTDPTVIYAVTNGTMELDRRLTHKDLRTEHPFNTYMKKGLPPAPICNPGRDSISAALRPLKTDEIYFVADGTGGHVFSKTFDEHRRNIANWKRSRRQKYRAAAAKRRAALKRTGKTIAPVSNAAEPPVLRDDVVSADILDAQDVSLDIVGEVPADPAAVKTDVPAPEPAAVLKPVEKKPKAVPVKSKKVGKRAVSKGKK